MVNTTIVDIRKKVKKSIDRADDTTVKMIQAMLEVQEKETENSDAVFTDEIQRRIDEYEQGTARTYTFDEVVESARNSYEKRRQSLK